MIVILEKNNNAIITTNKNSYTENVHNKQKRTLGVHILNYSQLKYTRNNMIHRASHNKQVPGGGQG